MALEAGWRAAEAALLTMVAFVTACGTATPSDAGSGRGDADAVPGRDADARSDGETEEEDGADATTEPGPITLVANERGVTAERMCDVDGNGSLDNAVANLGAPADEILAAVVSAAFQQTIIEAGVRTILHFPRIDDLAGPDDPDTVLLAFNGQDVDEPEHPEDDFSGDEAFYATPEDIDACGEPRVFSVGAAIREGQLDAPLGTVTLDTVTIQGDARALGTIEAHGTSGLAYMCGYVTVASLGSIAMDDATWLEAFVGGGLRFGVPTVPGVSPDIDLDDDGLERFILSDEGRLATCVDGDGHTTIDGRDCWQDPRIADAISLTVFLRLVSARFAGRRPGWELEVPGECDEPPEQSLWEWR